MTSIQPQCDKAFTHTHNKPPPDHDLHSGMERTDRDRPAPLINWRWGSWCQCSSLGRWWEDRWDRCWRRARGQKLKPEIHWLDKCWHLTWLNHGGREKRRLPCRASDRLCTIAGMLAACLSVCLWVWWSGLHLAGVFCRGGVGGPHLSSSLCQCWADWGWRPLAFSMTPYGDPGWTPPTWHISSLVFRVMRIKASRPRIDL